MDLGRRFELGDDGVDSDGEGAREFDRERRSVKISNRSPYVRFDKLLRVSEAVSLMLIAQVSLRPFILFPGADQKASNVMSSN